MSRTSARWLASAALTVLTSTSNLALAEPCNLSFVDGLTSAKSALDCLRSVPIHIDDGRTQLAGLRVLLEYQSDLAYLRTSQAARLYPDVDLLAGLDDIEQRLDIDFYLSEYDFQLDISRLFASAYDGHLVYVPDIVDVFHFFRREAGQVFPLVSISKDSLAKPEVFGARDLSTLSGSGDVSYQPSPVIDIDGRSAQDVLKEHASYAGNLHDPDGNYNLLFYNPRRLSTGSFERIYSYTGGDSTLLSFENGTERRLDIVAKSTLDLAGVQSGRDLFERCCRSNLLEMFEPVLSGRASISRRDTRHFLRSSLQAIFADSDSKRASAVRPLLNRRQIWRRPYSELPIENPDGSVGGYFPSFSDDLAVLKVASFAPSQPEDFQSVVRRFLSTAYAVNKTRLIIDLSGNQGGTMFLPHDLFRQLFPREYPYDATNFRATSLLNFTGTAISRHFEDFASDFLTTQGAIDSLYAGPGNPFNYQPLFNASDGSFDSWQDLFGPLHDPAVDDRFTSLIRPNIDDPLQTNITVSP